MPYESINLFYAYLYGLIAFAILIVILKLMTAQLVKLPNVVSSVIIFVIWVPSILKRIINAWDYGKIVEIALIASVLLSLWLIDTFKVKFLTNNVNSNEWYKNPLKLLVALGVIIGAIIVQL